MTELDRLLKEIRPPEPSPRFTAEVMDAVRRQVADSPLRFPWRILGIGLLATTVLTGLAATTTHLAPGAAGLLSSGKLGWLAGIVAVSVLAVYLPVELYGD